MFNHSSVIGVVVHLLLGVCAAEAGQQLEIECSLERKGKIARAVSSTLAPVKGRGACLGT